MSELLVIEPPDGDITMEPCRKLFHPDTLIMGEHYLFVDRCSAEANQVMRVLQFVAYTACPGVVAVLDGSGEKMRVLRDDLYAISLSSRDGTMHDGPSAT